MQIHSFCDHVRQLYYKFRSRGILAYSAVSSSIVNSNQQVRLDVCVISQLEDGHFYLEDLTGTVEINI
ncbi:hypothetical protein LOK49_LG08G02863 [Camellia lanceoleosa]|uniref:Uncharacterized protein n=1 Tax=Camellia lanceoleosa TaxID=1840588 RepID=A0ACC0GMA7_9ERIC|nr:hypothetical protein LOK49_LG08G02863 [Camellia lanceoleosa]